jgi:hypothetical protein
MRCNPSARWGPGTTKERVIDSEGSKELKERMEQMMKEREKQNAMWINTELSQKKELTPMFSSFTSTTTTPR